MSKAQYFFAFVITAAASTSMVVQAKPRHRSNLAESLKSAEYYADCVVKKRPAMARAAIMDDEHYIQKKYPKLIDPGCLQDKPGSKYISKLSFPDDTLHEILSTALVRSDYAESGPIDFSNVAPLPEIDASFATESQLAAMSQKNREEYLKREKTTRSWILLSKIGECTARLAPEQVRLLALTPVTSVEEKNKLNDLLPHIQDCAPANLTFRIQRSNLRGPLVRAYYTLARLSVTPSATVEAK